MIKKRNRKIEPIGSNNQKKNTRSRRGKNLMKKSYELSVLCGLEVNLTIYDRKRNRMTEYSSNENFTHEEIHKLIYPGKSSSEDQVREELDRTHLHTQIYCRPLNKPVSKDKVTKNDQEDDEEIDTEFDDPEESDLQNVLES